MSFTSSKFSNSRVAAMAYGHSACEECGSVDENGRWYGRYNFRRAVVILSECSQGFVDYEIVSHADADGRWAEIESWVTPEDEEEFSEPSEEDYTIADARDGAGGGGYGAAVVGHNYLGTFDTREDAEDAIRDHAGDNFRPNVWFISDHGNAHLIEDFDWRE